MPESIELPTVNDRAWFSLKETTEHLFPSRIEDIQGNRISVAAPLTHMNESSLTTLEVPPEAQRCTLVWKNGTGYAQQHCYVTASHPGDLELWDIVLLGDSEQLQRREHVRVPDDASAHLHFADRSVDVQLLDLSEGGLSCQLTAFDLTVEHFPVFADLLIADFQVLIPGQVVRAHDHIDGQMTLAVKFVSIKDVHADLIRRHVFGKQIKMQRDGAA